jgi:CYTH domain-containing protein
MEDKKSNKYMDYIKKDKLFYISLLAILVLLIIIWVISTKSKGIENKLASDLLSKGSTYTEIERRWLIRKDDIPFDLNAITREDQEQSYLDDNPEIIIRRNNMGESFYIESKANKRENGLVDDKTEKTIIEKEYKELFEEKVGNTLIKTRLITTENDVTYIMDLYSNELSGIEILEIEFYSVEDANKFVAPEWVGREITYDEDYNGYNLATRGAPVTIE